MHCNTIYDSKYCMLSLYFLSLYNFLLLCFMICIAPWSPYGINGMSSFLKKHTSFLLPCPFTDPKMFCAGPNFLSQLKNLTAFSASSKTFVPAQKPILLNANHLFVWHKMLVTCTMWKKKICAGKKKLDQHKTFWDL